MANPDVFLPWRQRRDQLRAELPQHLPAGVGEEEVEAHFRGMPAYYWERVDLADLVWGLETIHGFLKLVASPEVPATTPFVSWRQVPHGDRTRVMLCTWDRHGLLAKAAAAFSGARLNILEADVFTRADNVVLDVFSVVDGSSGAAACQERLQEMTSLVDGALSEPPRFASLPAQSQHPFMVKGGGMEPSISFDNASAINSTIILVDATDRLGLLHDLLQALADAGLNITQARIATEGDIVHDMIHVIDAYGQKILDPRHLHELRGRLEDALSGRP